MCSTRHKIIEKKTDHSFIPFNVKFYLNNGINRQKFLEKLISLCKNQFFVDIIYYNMTKSPNEN